MGILEWVAANAEWLYWIASLGGFTFGFVAFMLGLADRWKARSAERLSGPRHVSAVLETDRDILTVRNDGPLPVVIQDVALGPGERPEYLLFAPPMADSDDRVINGWPPELQQVASRGIDPLKPFSPYKRNMDLRNVPRFLPPGAAMEVPSADHHIRIPNGSWPLGESPKRPNGSYVIVGDDYVQGAHIPEITFVDSRGVRWVKCEQGMIELKPSSRRRLKRYSRVERTPGFEERYRRAFRLVAKWHRKKPRRFALGPRLLAWRWDWRAGPVAERGFPRGLPEAWRYDELLEPLISDSTKKLQASEDPGRMDDAPD